MNGLLNETPERDTRAEEHYGDWLGDATNIQPASVVAGPLPSVLLPVHNPPTAVFEAALESVLAQAYTHWELCIADDASTQPHVRATKERFVARDPRVRVVYRPEAGHFTAATNSALAITAVVAAEPLVDWVYSDEDKLSEEGVRVAPFSKPAWSPTLLLSCNYVTHLAADRLHQRATARRFPLVHGRQSGSRSLPSPREACALSHTCRVSSTPGASSPAPSPESPRPNPIH